MLVLAKLGAQIVLNNANLFKTQDLMTRKNRLGICETCFYLALEINDNIYTIIYKTPLLYKFL